MEISHLNSIPAAVAQLDNFFSFFLHGSRKASRKSLAVFAAFRRDGEGGKCRIDEAVLRRTLTWRSLLVLGIANILGAGVIEIDKTQETTHE